MSIIKLHHSIYSLCYEKRHPDMEVEEQKIAPVYTILLPLLIQIFVVGNKLFGLLLHWEFFIFLKKEGNDIVSLCQTCRYLSRVYCWAKSMIIKKMKAYQTRGKRVERSLLPCLNQF